MAQKELDPLAVHDPLVQLERAGNRQVMVANGSHRAEYEDATEWIDPLSDLTNWTVGSVTVSGNKILGSGSGVPVAKRALALGTTGRGRFTALVSLPTSWAAKTFYIGVSTDSDVATALNPTLIGIGVRSTGNISRFLGNGFTGGNSAGTNLTNTAVLSGVTGAQTLLVTVTVDENSIGFSMRALTGTSAGLEWTYSVARSVAPGAITQAAVYNADSNGASGATVSNVGAKVSNGSFRTRTLEGQDVQVGSVIAASGDRWRIQLPIGYDSRKPCPVVLYCHQARTGWEQAPAFESRARPVATALSNAGFILASAQDGSVSTGSNSSVGSSGDRWGNQASLDNFLALYKYVRDHYATSAVCLLGVSMGGLAVLNLLAQRKLPGVVAVAGVAGVYDLSKLYPDTTNFQADIKVAYGIASDSSDYDTKTAGYNPAVGRTGAEYRGVAFRWYSSASDTVVTKVDNADKLIAQVTPYALEANVVTASGAHLDASQFQGSDLVSFYQRALLQ